MPTNTLPLAATGLPLALEPSRAAHLMFREVSLPFQAPVSSSNLPTSQSVGRFFAVGVLLRTGEPAH